MKKTCKGCKAIDGHGHPNYVTDFKNAKCLLGYKTVLINGVMMPVSTCPKPKSWKMLERLLKEKRFERVNIDE